MSKLSFSVYLDGGLMAAIDERAASAGKTRSGWAAQVLERAIGGELSSYDDLMLEQITKVRAGLEVIIEQVVQPQPKQDVRAVRERVATMADKFATSARERIRR